LIPKLIEYNINDVLATKALLERLTDAIQLRQEIEEVYGIQALSRDGMKIGISILKKFYCDRMGITPRQLDHIQTTRRDCVPLKDCILPFIHFKDNELSNLLLQMMNDVQMIDENGHAAEYGYKVKYANKLYHIGSGGLHSDDEAGVFKSNNRKKIIDYDVASYYPSLMMTYKFVPEHLGNDLLEIYKEIYKQRIRAKRAKKKVEAETLKLSLNGTFGNLLQQYS
jgi:hypothetical protein